MSERINVYYGRVSTKKHEQDSSVINQEMYFKEKGINKGYIDRSGGTTIDKRPEFQEMLNQCGLSVKKIKSGTKHKSVVVDSNKESKVKYIYTKSIQRFARNVSECLEICRMLSDKGTYVIFEDLNKSTEDKSFFMTMSIMATMAENESLEKSRSIKMGSKMTAKQGKVRSFSAYGFSYNKIDNTLIAIPEEAEILKKIFELKSQGLGNRRIANILNEEGHKTRNNKEWLPNVISRIIKNPIYYGATARNRYDTNKLYGNNKHVLKPEEEWIVIENEKIEPIITKELFDKCQTVRKENTSHNIKVGKYQGISELAGKINCMKCNQSYTRNKDTKVREYGTYERVFYNCSTKKRFGKSKCDARNVPSEEIENLLNIYVGKGKYKKVADNFLNKGIYEKATKAIKRLEDYINNTEDKYKIEANKSEINKLKDKLKKLLDVYLDDGIAKEVFEETQNDIKNKINELEKENSKLSESENEIRERINSINNTIEAGKKLIEGIPEDLSREEFIENYLISINVKENGELSELTKVHASFVLLNKYIEGAEHGENRNKVNESKGGDS